VPQDAEKAVFSPKSKKPRVILSALLRPVNNAGKSIMLELDQQHGRGLLWLVVAFAAGIALFFSWSEDPPPAVIITLPLLGLMLAITGRRAHVLKAGGIALIALGLGQATAHLRTAIVAAPVLAREIGPVFLAARVAEADRRDGGNRIIIEDFEIPGLAAEETPERLRITLPVSHGLPVVGDRISVRVIVRPAGPPVVPDGFQFQRYLYFNSIGGTGFSLGQWTLEKGALQPEFWRAMRANIEGIRRTVGDRITEIVEGPDGTVAAALINGEQSAIPQNLQEAYRVSGIAHLLSISGVHMSLLAGIVFFLMRRLLALTPLALRMDTKKLAAWVGLGATGFYLMISGMSIPAVRSFLMVAVVLGAVLIDRTALSLRTLAWAALLLMVLFPEELFGASFQMSFLAVLSLIALYEQAWLKVKWRSPDGEYMILRAVGMYIAALVVTDFVAGAATSLFAAYHFNRLPTYSLIANLAAVPITGAWIMPAGLAGLLLMPLGLERWPFELMGVGVTLINDIARGVASWPGAQIHVQPMPAAVMCLAALGGILICLWNGRWRWAGALLILPAIIQPGIARSPDLLVDESARVFAVSDQSGHLAFMPGRSGRFVREVWRDRYGASPEDWPRSGESNGQLGLRCDADGCIFERGDQRILLAFRSNVIVEDCGSVDVIISSVATYDLCRAENAYDIIDFRRDGTHSFWFTQQGVISRTAEESTGQRIWTKTERD
jgi:competence protein ComEC